MKLITDAEEYRFDSSDYEPDWLDLTEFEIRITDDIHRIEESIMGTDSCIRYDNEHRDQFFEDFSNSGHTYFFEIQGGGYARAVEMESEFGPVSALDAIKTPGEDFDLERFRAGVLAVIKHGEENKFSHMVGGHNFFTDEDLNPIDLNYNGSDQILAPEIYFGYEIDENDLKLNHETKPNSKGELWELYESYMIREL
jgi:hypothetical protein